MRPRLTKRGYFTNISTLKYMRFNVSPEIIYREIIKELAYNNIDSQTAIVNCRYRFKKMETDGKVLFLSERGLCSLFVTICTVGNYSQVQIVLRNVPRGYSFEDANHCLEYSMLTHYEDVILTCVESAVNRIAAASNLTCISSDQNDWIDD